MSVSAETLATERPGSTVRRVHSGAPNYDGAVLNGRIVAAIDAAVESEMERRQQPGLTIGVTDRDRTLTVRTYGFADLAAQRPVTPETLFEIGSIGKSFTAVATLQLVDEGRIELDAPVDRYLPWLVIPTAEDNNGPVTVSHLLSHTAGIVAGLDATPEATFQVWALRDLPTFSAPGERFHYSNLGYKVLGLVLEAVDGQTYPEIVRARILGPLGMRATEPAITNEIRARLAVGYEYLHDDHMGYAGAELAPATWLETGTADGCLASTASDMCEFARLILRSGEGPNGRLLSADAFARMTTAHAREDDGGAYGYGLSMREIDGRRLIGHGGSMVGYLAGMETDLDAGLGVIVLQNGFGARPMALARTVLGIVSDLEGGTHVAAESSSATDDGYGAVTGLYTAEDGGLPPLELVVSEGLALRTDGKDIVLEKLADDLFLVPDAAFDEFPLRLERPVDGAPELWHGGRRYVRAGATVGRLPEPSAELRAIAGHYRSHNPWTTNFRVVLRGDRPWLVFAGAPGSFAEQPLLRSRDGWFRIGEDPGNPERLRFDAVAEGRALRAWFSGWPYYRAD
jgi:CubicO group peptidase (beta-lactamase class C family)